MNLSLMSPVGGMMPDDAAAAALPTVAELFQHQAESAYLHAETDRARIDEMANDPATASNPDRLWELQQLQEDYTKRMTLASVMVNHVVQGVETLVKT